MKLSERERMEVIAALEEMRREIAFSRGRVEMKREKLAEIDARIRRMKNLHDSEHELMRKARRNAS